MSVCPNCSLELRDGMVEECDVCADRVPLVLPDLTTTFKRDAGKADQVIVAALLDGHRFEGALWAERITAAETLLRVRPDMTRAEVGHRVGMHARSIERLAERLNRGLLRRPVREEVVEKIMAGKTSRIVSTPAERTEALRRMLRDGTRSDRDISRLTGVSLGSVRGHRYRAKETVDAGD